MKTPSFEIKVALLGNVSAGKTTVLNALLRDKYGEVAMKRTTVGVNYFRIHTKKKSTSSVDESKDTDETTEALTDAESSKKSKNSPTNSSASNSPTKWTDLPDNPRSAESTLSEITKDNQLKLVGGDVQEKEFDIEMDEPLCKMRDDTKLIITDIPGLNEAGVFNKYKEFVKQKWHTFDCVILVMDGKQGVNTEDQVFLLKLIKECSVSIKQVPVIILCNKVDDPEDEEQVELIREARLEVEKIFGVRCRESALRELLAKQNTTFDTNTFVREEIFPAFIPISAIYAYIHRSGAVMSLERFKGFDKDLLEKLGRDQIGRRRWGKLTPEQKIKEVYDIIQDPEEQKACLEESNFLAFLKVLQCFIGGEKRQQELIEKQIETDMKFLSESALDPGDFPQGMIALYDKQKNFSSAFGGTQKLENATKTMKTMFWDRYNILDKKVYEAFEEAWPKKMELPLLHDLMTELEMFVKVADTIGLMQTEKQEIVLRMKYVVCRYFDFLLNQSNRDAAYNESNVPSNKWRPSKDMPEWLSPYEWSLIFRSVLLLSYDRNFCETFGRHKILFETVMPDVNAWLRNNFSRTTGTCGKCNERLIPHKQIGLKCNKCSHVQCYNSDGIDFPGQNSFVGVSAQTTKYNADWLLSIDSDSMTGAPEPCHKNIYNQMVHIQIPSSPSDPKHFGHLPWRFCRFLNKQEVVSRNMHPPSDPVSTWVQECHTNKLWREIIAKNFERTQTFPGVENKASPASCPDYQKILTDFYTKHNPKKMHDVEKLLQNFKGREHNLFARLAQQYQVPNPLDELYNKVGGEEMKGAKSTSAASKPFSFSTSSSSSKAPTFSFAQASSANQPASFGGFSFAQTSSATNSTTTGFSFGSSTTNNGSQPSNTQPTSGFSFGGSSSFGTKS